MIVTGNWLIFEQNMIKVFMSLFASCLYNGPKRYAMFFSEKLSSIWAIKPNKTAINFKNKIFFPLSLVSITSTNRFVLNLQNMVKLKASKQ